MASQMVVPASRDTLFMRGFSARRDIDEIRDFFSDEGGRCSVEFFKESDDKSKLYVALKFENKDIAKELLNKYDNTEVLGDRITISWFKDLRRARFNANANRNRRSNWSPDRYDKYKGKYYSGSRYMSNRWSSGYGSRSRRYERSYSRSRSRSSSYSRSRSRSTSPRRSHSRSKSSDSYEDRKHRRRHSKRESHKSDRRKGRDRRSRERSASVTRESRDRSEEPDDDIVDEKRDKKSLERRSPAKVIQSAVKAVDHESDNDSSTEMSMSEDEIDKVSNQSLEYHPKSGGPESSKYVDATPAEPGMVARMERQKRPLSRELQPPSTDSMKEQYFSPQQEFDNSPQPPPTKVHSAGRYTTEMYEKQFDRDQEYVQSYKQNIRTTSPSSRSSMQDKEVLPGGGKVEKEYVVIREGREMACGELRNPRQEARYSEERQKLVINTSERVPQKQVADIQSPMETSYEMGRVQRSAEPEGGGLLGFERKLVHEYDEFKAPVRKQDDFDKRQKFVESPITREVRHELYEEVSQVDRISGPKEQRKVNLDRPEQSSGDYGQPPMERGGVVGADRMRGLRDNGTHLMERGQSVVERGLQSVPSGSGRMMSNRERSPLFDDHESTGSGHSATRSVGPQSYNGGLMKEVEKGALGLPQDKMALVREKKDEIEKSYRQDCETFAAVTKMLISKDTWLEDKLQASLKENLKDIGQRCIHELREFIEALKSESQRG